MAEVWEERYVSKEWGKETKASFTYFQRYIQQNYPRSIRKLHEEIVAETLERNSVTKSERKPIKIKTLYTYSQKWKWLDRAKEFDEHLVQVHLQQKMNRVRDWEAEQLGFAMTRANYHNDSLNELHKLTDDKIPIDKRVGAESENQRAYKQAVEDVYKLLYGGSIPNQNRNETNLKGNIKQEVNSVSNLFDKNKVKEILDAKRRRNGRDSS